MVDISKSANFCIANFQSTHGQVLQWLFTLSPFSDFWGEKKQSFMNWKKMTERLFAEIDQQTWFSRMICWQIFTGTLLLVQMRSLYFQGIKKRRAVYLRSFAHSWIPSFPTALKASPFLHLHLQVFISAGLNRALLKRKDSSSEINFDLVRVFFSCWSAVFFSFWSAVFSLSPEIHLRFLPSLQEGGSSAEKMN